MKFILFSVHKRSDALQPRKTSVKAAHAAHLRVHSVTSLVVSWLHREIIVTKPYLVTKEAQLYSLYNGEKSSSILLGETFLLAN